MADGWQGAFHCHHFSCKSSHIIYAAHLPSFPRKPPLHPDPTLSCKNEQFLFLRFDAMLTGVTLIDSEVWNFDLSCFFCFFFLSSRGCFFADIGSCHFATPCDVGDTQPIWQVLDSRRVAMRAGNLSEGKVPKCVNEISIDLSQDFFFFLISLHKNINDSLLLVFYKSWNKQRSVKEPDPINSPY